MARICLLFVPVLVSLSLVAGEHLAAQQKETAETSSQQGNASVNRDAAQPDRAIEGREQRLAKYLSGSKFVGKFTIDGKEDDSPETEEYTIGKCEKLPEADMYRLTARIKYGDIDSEVPLDLKILWSGNTPVITLDSFWIPGIGTFDARVMIHANRYAGTWQHDEVGGHMFGAIKK